MFSAAFVDCGVGWIVLLIGLTIPCHGSGLCGEVVANQSSGLRVFVPAICSPVVNSPELDSEPAVIDRVVLKE